MMLGGAADSYPAADADEHGGGKRGESNGTSGSIDQIVAVFEEDERAREIEESDRNFAGNRWPHDETLALIKVRSEMDAAFRESSVKGPLWDEVSRELGALGFSRSSKKCKEKFENIYKYYRRTKESGQRPNGKTYRFFEQLEAIDQNPLPLTSISPSMMDQLESANRGFWIPDSTTIAMNVDPVSVCVNATVQCQEQNVAAGDAADNVTTWSTWTDLRGKEIEGMRKKAKNKRKFSEFFDRLMQEVTMKQEELQRRFVEAIERYEVDRVAREEAWRVKETERIRREHELLVQERSIAAAKDAAVIALLQKFSHQEIPVQFTENLIPVPKDIVSLEKQEKMGIVCHKPADLVLHNNSSPSRWPRAEVEALINMRSTFDMQYQENGPKGPLWEEISLAMKKLGYDRSAKRCKEKWENINKYFKRVRDSNKKRPEDSRTCPYFHLLDNLYKRKANNAKQVGSNNNNIIANSGDHLNPIDLLASSCQIQQQENEAARVEGDDTIDRSPDQIPGENDEDEYGENYQVVVNNPTGMSIMEEDISPMS